MQSVIAVAAIVAVAESVVDGDRVGATGLAEEKKNR